MVITVTKLKLKVTMSLDLFRLDCGDDRDDSRYYNGDILEEDGDRILYRGSIDGDRILYHPRHGTILGEDSDRIHRISYQSNYYDSYFEESSDNLICRMEKRVMNLDFSNSDNVYDSDCSSNSSENFNENYINHSYTTNNLNGENCGNLELYTLPNKSKETRYESNEIYGSNLTGTNSPTVISTVTANHDVAKEDIEASESIVPSSKRAKIFQTVKSHNASAIKSILKKQGNAVSSTTPILHNTGLSSSLGKEIQSAINCATPLKKESERPNGNSSVPVLSVSPRRNSTFLSVSPSCPLPSTPLYKPGKSLIQTEIDNRYSQASTTIGSVSTRDSKSSRDSGVSNYGSIKDYIRHRDGDGVLKRKSSDCYSGCNVQISPRFIF